MAGRTLRPCGNHALGQKPRGIIDRSVAQRGASGHVAGRVGEGERGGSGTVTAKLPTVADGKAERKRLGEGVRRAAAQPVFNDTGGVEIPFYRLRRGALATGWTSAPFRGRKTNTGAFLAF
jgi:hypothetical protein